MYLQLLEKLEKGKKFKKIEIYFKFKIKKTNSIVQSH